MKQPESGQRPPESVWASIKYYLGMAAVVLSLAVLFLMIFDGVVRNGQCSFYEHITFECNRWKAKFKPWE